MRKVIAALGISLDGYIARPDGAVDFLFMPKDYSNAEFWKSVDTAVMCRKTYDVGRKMGGSFGMPLYVFSRKSRAGERDGVTYTNEPPATVIANLRKVSGKHIWLMGGGELIRDFLKDDLVDEIHLGILPVLLGDGIPLFPGGFPERDFHLLENKTCSKGFISVKYERLRKQSRNRKQFHKRTQSRKK